jgi:predicted nucleotidyltransferase
MKKNLARVLKQKLAKLKKSLAGDPRVLAVFLFGSQVEGYATARSDIDLAELFDRDLTVKEELEFETTLCEILGVYEKLDVVNLKRANLAFRYRAVAGTLLYQQDFVRVFDFIERTLMARRDFAPRLNLNHRTTLAQLVVQP